MLHQTLPVVPRHGKLCSNLCSIAVTIPAIWHRRSEHNLILAKVPSPVAVLRGMHAALPEWPTAAPVQLLAVRQEPWDPSAAWGQRTGGSAGQTLVHGQQQVHRSCIDNSTCPARAQINPGGGENMAHTVILNESCCAFTYATMGEAITA
jgi:hypothetical protein